MRFMRRVLALWRVDEGRDERRREGKGKGKIKEKGELRWYIRAGIRRDGVFY
jgi:hypothetical protein